MNIKRGITNLVLGHYRRVSVALLITFGMLSPVWNAIAGGTWVPLANKAPSNISIMELLPDGTIMANGGVYNNWYRLTPDKSGSYINGTWSTLAPMHDNRGAYALQVLKDGRVFVAGGEDESGSGSAEVYDPLLDDWTMCPGSGSEFSDSISEILPNGDVLIAPVGPTNIGGTMIYNPESNTWIAGPTLYRGYNQAEESWVKLADGSILSIDGIDGGGTNSERYIPSLNQWINDANVPVLTFSSNFEVGAAFLLPTSNAFFLGATGNTAIYVPSGSTNMGTWIAGPIIPDGQVASDAPAAMMVNGKVLCLVSHGGTYDNEGPPSTFAEYDPYANAFTTTSSFAGSTNFDTGPCKMLDIPDGSVLFSFYSGQLYAYQPDGTALIAGRPTIINITTNFYRSYHLTGTLLNGITEGAGFGDDAQMNSNYPLVRMTNADGHIYYARTYNWSSTGVMTGTNIVSTEFMVPENLPGGTYSLVVVANGNSSAPVPFTFNPDPLSITVPTGFASSGSFGGPFNPVNQAYSLSNTGPSLLNWSLINTSLWLNVSSTGGAVIPGGQSMVIASLSSSATNLPIGIYTASVWFTNLSTGTAQSIPFRLKINPLLQNGGFEYGSFADWKLSGDQGSSLIMGDHGIYDGPRYSSHSGNYAAFLGMNNSMGYVSQTLPTVPGQSYLLSLFVSSPPGASGSNEFAITWDGLSLFDQQNLLTLGWTNLQFIVRATSKTTALEFSFVNASNYFMLDDVVLSNLASTIFAPLILAQPEHQYLSGFGSEAGFSVLAFGNAPLTYQWQFNGTNLSGASTSSLAIVNVQATDLGNYVVIVTNAYGSVTSSVASLVVATCDPAPSSLQHWWRAEDNTVDAVGGIKGTLSGGFAYASGEVGQALVMDGTSGWVDIPDDPSLSPTGPFSIEFWENANPSQFGYLFLMVGKSHDFVDTTGWLFLGDSISGQLEFGVGDGANWVTTGSTNNVLDNQWHHVAGVWDGTQICFYLDGVLRSTTPEKNPPAKNTYDMEIGSSWGGGSRAWYFHGMIDEVSYYDRALYSNEVAALFNAGAAGKCLPSVHITSIQPSAFTLNVTWNALFGSGYQVQYETDISQGRWINFGNPILATNSTVTISDSRTNSQQFYRVRVLP